MSGILKVAFSGLQAQRHNLDIIANNIANLNTTAFKKTRASFSDAVSAATGTGTENLAGSGVTLAANQRSFSPGALSETGRPWDLAIVGGGFFQVLTNEGARAYTRDGTFSVDADGRLVTVQGFLVDPPVTVPANARDIRVDENGAVFGKIDETEQKIADIALASFANPEGLLGLGQNMFVPTESSGPPLSGQAGSEGRGLIYAGALETSNVNLTEEMTKAIETQRAYQLSIKVLQAADEMLGMANKLRT